jgi:hypothetical protein
LLHLKHSRPSLSGHADIRSFTRNIACQIVKRILPK